MKKCCRVASWQVASQFREESMKETDILGRVPCSTLPQKDLSQGYIRKIQKRMDLSSQILSLCWPIHIHE